MADYPSAAPSFPLKSDARQATPDVHADDHNDVDAEVVAIGTDLVMAMSPEASMEDRLLALDALIAAKQDGNANLTAISLLTTTAYGLSLLSQADAPSAQALLELIIGTDVQAWDANTDALLALYATLTKGKLFVGTGAGTLGLLSIGSNGQVLTLDSAQTTGVKWSTPSGSGDLLSTANLSDVGSAPTSRYNLHVGILQSAQAVSTANVASLSGTTTIDGVSVVAGDIVLLTAQSTGAENGPWTIASGSWTRPLDYPTTGTVRGRVIHINQGTTYIKTLWAMLTATTVTVDTTATTWGNMTPPQSAVAITGGTITGITDLAVADGGTGASNTSDAKTNLAIGYSSRTRARMTFR